MIYKKALLFLFFITFAFGGLSKVFINIDKQMLKGKILYTYQYGSDLTLRFLPASIEPFDGDIVFHFSSNADNDNEILSYKIIDGRLIYYGNDGSRHRLTLLSVNNGTWTVTEEEDVDGDDKQFGFGEAVEKIYTQKKSEQAQTARKSMPLSYTNDPSTPKERIDQLTMEIYGRLDISVESRREYIDSINKFLDTASLILIKKHKIDIQLEEIRQHQMAAVAAPPELAGLMYELDSIEKLDGSSIVDHDENILTTMAELQQVFSRAGERSMDFQRYNYKSGKEREVYLAKLEELLARSGTSEQKYDFKRAEIWQSQDTYSYYKNFLDTPSVWCLVDKNVSQKKSFFLPKAFITEGLYRQYKAELSRSQNPYDTNEVPRRAKKLEEESQKIKHQFNRDYLYDLQRKLNRLEK